MANSVDPDEQSDMLFTQTCLSENFGPLTVDKEHQVFIITKDSFFILKANRVFSVTVNSHLTIIPKGSDHHFTIVSFIASCCLDLFQTCKLEPSPLFCSSRGVWFILLFSFNRNSFIKCILHLLIWVHTVCQGPFNVVRVFSDVSMAFLCFDICHSGKYQNKEKPLKHQRRLGLPLMECKTITS